MKPLKTTGLDIASTELTQLFAAPNAQRSGHGDQPQPTGEHIRLKLYFALIITDSLAIALGFLVAGISRFGDIFDPRAMTLVSMTLPIYLIAALNTEAFTLDVLATQRRGLSRALMALLFAVSAVLFIGFFIGTGKDFSRIAVAVGGLTSAVVLVSARSAFGPLSVHFHKGTLITNVVITDGVSMPALDGYYLLDAAKIGLSPDMRDPMMLDRLGCLLKGADRVIVACGDEQRKSWAMALKGANIRGEIIALELLTLGALGTSSFATYPTVVVSTGALGMRNRIFKRVLDLSICIALLPMLAPVMILTAIAIRLDSSGPVFFMQQRLGWGNRLFRMYKFRSMRPESCDASGNRSAQRDDDRVTRIGRIIRSTSLDELPQLLNVLKGNMSFVGPRPHALGSLAGDKLFWEIDERYWHRHAAKPGLTGLAQVRGFRGATLEQSDLTNRLQADLEYLNGWSIWRDIGILLRTFQVLIHRNAF